MTTAELQMKRMRKWAVNLSTELLHTPKGERPALIMRRTTEARAHVYCSYCGEEQDFGGLSDAEIRERLIGHIAGCEKRPELKFLNIALAAQEVVDAFLDRDGSEGWERHSVAVQTLKTHLDKLKVTT